MYAAACELKYAQKVKRYLQERNLFHPDVEPIKELGFMYFPLKKYAKIPHATIRRPKFSFPQKQKPKTIHELLEGKLTKKEQQCIPRTQEIIGDIMILEIPQELKKKEKIIANAYLKQNPRVKTIVKKTAMHEGVYRTREVKVLAGKPTKQTIHHENGIKIHLHLERTYYSARSANERLRIAKQIKKGEQVLVMFSGAAPFPLVIAKNSPASIIYGVELNPDAHRYAMQNITLNKLESKIAVFEGDVCKIVPKLDKTFNRIVMPLPKTGEEFLEIALKKAKPNATIHLYAFLDEKEIESDAKRIVKHAKKLGYNLKCLRSVKCGQFSPGTFRVTHDLKLRR